VEDPTNSIKREQNEERLGDAHRDVLRRLEASSYALTFHREWEKLLAALIDIVAAEVATTWPDDLAEVA
jgi:hypothetical protein